MWTEYHGWMIRAHRQIHYPPYLDFVAYGKRETATKVFMFNVEGRTLEEAIERVKREIDQRTWRTK